MSDVKISLTQNQYCTLMAFSQAIPRVLTAPPPELTPTETRSTPVTPDITTPPNKSEQSGAAAVDLQPELSTIARTEGGVIHQYTSLDLVFTVSSVKLALFDDRAIRESDLKGCGIARFALDDTSLRFKSMSDGAAEAEVVLKSFTVSNTRVGNSRFREIIPARHNRDQAQFMVLYTSSGKGSEQSSLILVTIDSPNIIFAVDPVFAMLDFAMSAFPSNPVEPMPQDTAGVTKPVSSDTPSQLAFRVDLHDVSISILESDSDPESQAIQMTIKQILMSQQVFRKSIHSRFRAHNRP
jgi:vacuolar protein sorting-associated protein 13A/C